jgi:hypothetical protein
MRMGFEPMYYEQNCKEDSIWHRLKQKIKKMFIRFFTAFAWESYDVM